MRIITMGPNSPRYNILTYPRRPNNVAETLSPRQADFLSVALRMAADDAGAAIAHQLSEPLTVLLLYLHEIKQRCEQSDGIGTVPDPVCEMADMALRATQRICEIIERVSHTIEKIDSEAAVARGWEAIDSLKWNIDARSRVSSTSLHASHYPLTPREREVLTLIADGASNKAGSHRLGISPRTFEAHRAHVMRKFGARNTADLVRAALNRNP
jgi:DNA-binding CsgD family transcriptional regulator